MNPLVNYESSSEEEETIVQGKRKATGDISETVPKMPKLPSFFRSSTGIPESDTQGRVRTVPHQEDSWATYVYVNVNLSEEFKLLQPYLRNVEIIDEPHISLSRPVYFRRFQLESFVNSIKHQMKDIKSFNLSFAQTSVLINDEKTRSFLTLEVGNGYNEMFECMKQVDSAMTQFHKQTFYDPPRFHASVAWSLKEEDVQNVKVPDEVVEQIISAEYLVTNVYIKMGNRLEKVPLAPKV